MTLEEAEKSALIYCDPPYVTLGGDHGFLRYTQQTFSWHDQRRLAAICNELAMEGRCVVVSNADHPAVLSLYDERAFSAIRVARASNLAAQSRARGRRTELLLVTGSIAAPCVDLGRPVDASDAAAKPPCELH